MAFRGVFIGVDRFESPGIKWLSCAGRDAIALHCLFADTLGPGGILLLDEKATSTAIRSSLESLCTCDPDDIVVVSFSGHGSDTHELIPYDCQPAKLAETSVSLDELGHLFSNIPARILICLLDCCFSGGAGAKVLKGEVTARSMESAESALSKMAGEGRLIFTASSATEPAWEVGRHGHGLFTWHVMSALQGPPEVLRDGRVSLYRLFEYVTEQVTAEAQRLGKIQNPALRGQIDQKLSWPVFCPGESFFTEFPDRRKCIATCDLMSLMAFGFPERLLTTWQSTIPSLNALQLEAINEYRILDGDNLLVSAPTSSGKTMIGELAALKGTFERKRAIFLLPLRALVNDKHQHFLSTYSDFGLRVIRATGEINDDIGDLTRGRYDICLMTYEKFASLVIALPHVLEQVGTVVVDELQMLADKNRGMNLEFILTVLLMRASQGIKPQIIGLSAVIGATHGFERWLGGRLLLKTERPVPLREGLLGSSGSLHYLDAKLSEKTEPKFIRPVYGKGSSQDFIIPLVQKLVGEGHQVIVFRGTKGTARGCALYLARDLGLKPANETLKRMPVGDPSNTSQALRGALQGGVGFHTADLDRDERSVLEEAFRRKDSEVRVLVATTTLAMGINTPAESVVIAGLEHPNTPPKPYSVAEYKNMVGRAGRLGMAESGNSFVICTSPQEENYFWKTYVCGLPEPIESRFFEAGADMETLVLRVLVALPGIAEGFKKEQILTFLDSSFGAFQLKQHIQGWKLNESQVLAAVEKLEGAELVEKKATGGFIPTKLGRLAGTTGVKVESMIRLIGTIRSMTPEEISDPALIGLTQLTVELGEVPFPINQRSTEKEPQAWLSALRSQGIGGALLQGFSRWWSGKLDQTRAMKKSSACLFYISDKPMVEIEAAMTQFGGGTNGAAGPVRSVASRTADLLETVIRTVEILHPAIELNDRPGRLLTRLQNGVSAKAADIASLFGSALSRGDYQALVRHNLHSVHSLNAASDKQIAEALGSSSGVKIAQMRRLLADNAREGASALHTLPVYES